MRTHRVHDSLAARLGAGLVLALLASFSASDVAAKPAAPVATPRNTDVRLFEPGLGELPFGDGVDGLTKWIGRRLDRTWGPRIAKAVDDKERAELRAARDKELADVTGNEVVFDGRRTGWESSIIAGEFEAGTHESAYLWRDGEVVHFFFMHEGKLWKYARRLEDGGGPFAGRLGEFESRLGPALAVEKESDGEGGQRPVSATWRGVSYDIKAVSRRMLYGGDLFILQDRGAAAKLEVVRAEERKKHGANGDATHGLDSFLLGPDGGNE